MLGNALGPLLMTDYTSIVNIMTLHDFPPDSFDNYEVYSVNPGDMRAPITWTVDATSGLFTSSAVTFTVPARHDPVSHVGLWKRPAGATDGSSDVFMDWMALASTYFGSFATGNLTVNVNGSIASTLPASYTTTFKSDMTIAMNNAYASHITQVSLHSDDPGATGLNEVTRQSFTWSNYTATLKRISCLFEVAPGKTISHVGFWGTAGFMDSVPLASALSFPNGGELVLDLKEAFVA